MLNECSVCFTTDTVHSCGDGHACQEHCPVMNPGPNGETYRFA